MVHARSPKYVRMEFLHTCSADIEALLSSEGQPNKSIPVMEPNAYVLTARNPSTQHLEGYAVYRMENKAATCVELYGNDHAHAAIPKAAQGLLRWRGARGVDKRPRM